MICSPSINPLIRYSDIVQLRPAENHSKNKLIFNFLCELIQQQSQMKRHIANLHSSRRRRHQTQCSFVNNVCTLAGSLVWDLSRDYVASVNRWMKWSSFSRSKSRLRIICASPRKNIVELFRWHFLFFWAPQRQNNIVSRSPLSASALARPRAECSPIKIENMFAWRSITTQSCQPSNARYACLLTMFRRSGIVFRMKCRLWLVSSETDQNPHKTNELIAKRSTCVWFRWKYPFS